VNMLFAASARCLIRMSLIFWHKS